ncbi:type VI secretion protein [Streptomyces sp. AV19]|uniref:type VI secretion protein n=1 Tax=Streptomyces sp. AV19 TaxID=2793068 RepID=UPI0024135806|nr:type VI secretion protein [Streptomyces sp. AV19]MDG4534604.1 TraG/TraD/VirD4 family protein [Streptomyces sp. AV19]
MEQDRRTAGGVPDGLLVSAIAFLLGVTLLAWTATGLSGLFANGHWPDGVSLMRTPQAMRHLMSDPRDLAAAWPDTPAEQLSGYGLFWGVTISEALVTTVLAVFLIGTVGRWRRGRTRPTPTPTPVPAPAPPVENTIAVAAPEPIAPPAPPPSPKHVVYGPERRAHAARAVLDAAGPVLVVTSDPELWAETKDARAKLGPVRVFDPGHLLDTPDRLRWNPAAGCESRDTAAARAAALLAPVRPPSSLDSLTAETAETLLRCWLHAAAVDGRPFRQVHRWAQGGSAHEAVRILRTSAKAAGGAAGELESALTAHPERRDMARELTSRALNCLSSVHIRDACSPNRADALALESFVAEGGTLYVVGEAIEDPRTRPGAMPLLTALAANVVERGRGVAERSPSGRLDPPLTLVLDDVAAVAPLPALPDLLETGSELGLPTLALMRSEEQARSRWPRSELSR